MFIPPHSRELKKSVFRHCVVQGHIIQTCTIPAALLDSESKCFSCQLPTSKQEGFTELNKHVLFFAPNMLRLVTEGGSELRVFLCLMQMTRPPAPRTWRRRRPARRRSQSSPCPAPTARRGSAATARWTAGPCGGPAGALSPAPAWRTCSASTPRPTRAPCGWALRTAGTAPPAGLHLPFHSLILSFSASHVH